MYVITTLKPSPLDKDGKLTRIISNIINESCGHCAAHGYTVLKVVQSSGDREPDLNFPVTASTVRGSPFSKYLPVIKVPGMLVIKRIEEVPGVYQKVVTSSIFDNWPIFAIAFLTMMLAGISIWILVMLCSIV